MLRLIKVAFSLMLSKEKVENEASVRYTGLLGVNAMKDFRVIFLAILCCLKTSV